MSYYSLGIEWSDSKLRITGFKKSGGKHVLTILDTLELPATTDQIIDTLRKWKDKNIPKDSDVKTVLSIPESLIFLKDITLPKVKDSQLSETVYWEVFSKSGTLPTDSILQWKKISEKKNEVRVSAFVLKSETAEKYLLIFEQVGLPLTAIEPSGLSFSRIADDIKNNSLLVNLQDEETNIILLENGVPVFSSSVAVDLTHTKSTKKRLSKDNLEKIVATAKKVISFWENQTSEKVENILLTSEGINYDGLVSEIKDALELDTKIAKHIHEKLFSTGKHAEKDISPLLIAFGAARRLFTTKHHPEVNLFPSVKMRIIEEDKRRVEKLSKLSLVVSTNIVLIVLLIASFAIVKLMNRAREGDIAQTNTFVKNHPGQAYTSKVTRTNSLLGRVNKLMMTQQDTGDRLRKISDMTPVGVQFTSIQMSSSPKEEWEISGIADRNDILAFYNKLKTDSGAKEVTMPYSNLQADVNSIFRIKLIW